MLQGIRVYNYTVRHNLYIVENMENMENKLVAAALAKGNLIKIQLNSRLNHLKRNIFSNLFSKQNSTCFVILIFFRI